MFPFVAGSGPVSVWLAAQLLHLLRDTMFAACRRVDVVLPLRVAALAHLGCSFLQGIMVKWNAAILAASEWLIKREPALGEKINY